MFKNYIKIALRSIKTHKGYSFINIAGLAVGLTCCVLILLWVQDELSYDGYHENDDRIYRITYAEEIGGAFDHYAVSPFAAAPAFTSEVPEVTAYARLWQRTGIISYNAKKFDERGIFYADKAFFEIFTHEFIKGDPNTALESPGSLVITQEMARKIFGNEDPLGKTLNLNADGDLKVTGVVRDVPHNSHFHFNYLVSMNTIQGKRAEFLDAWLAIMGWSYVLLDKRADPQLVEKKLVSIMDKHTGDEARRYGQRLFYYLQPLNDIHLRSHLEGEIEGNGDIRYVYVFSIIAVFFLLIACINFMNLSTARSEKRSKEVGLRKVLGAHKRRLIFQFLTESVGFSLFAAVLAINAVWFLLPIFNNLSGKHATMVFLLYWPVIISLFGLAALTGLTAGSYPAFFLSSFQPIDTLRKKDQRGSQSSILRNCLVIFQFTISIILIISTFIVLKQLNFMKNHKLGFKKEQVLAVRIKGVAVQEQFEVFRNELKKTQIFWELLIQMVSREKQRLSLPLFLKHSQIVYPLPLIIFFPTMTF
jgi:putative ABC transport system permease protein